jgi:hypothetical protein
VVGRVDMFEELETVVLTRGLPEAGLERGDVGAVVHRHPGGAYEVEFVTGDGETVAVLTLSEPDLRPLAPREILHARGIARG